MVAVLQMSSNLLLREGGEPRLQVNLVPRATCDPARDGPRSHEVTLSRGHRKVLPFDWLTGEQKIFVNYDYDHAALIRSQLQRTLHGLKKDGRASFKKHLPRLSDRKQQTKSEWSCGCRHQLLHKTKLRKTVNVNRNINIQPGQIPS